MFVSMVLGQILQKKNRARLLEFHGEIQKANGIEVWRYEEFGKKE